MVMNKKGQELTLGTVILIVLGIVVLIFLIFGFSTGWTNLWDRIINFGPGKVNLDTIKQGCELACAQQSVDGWCNLERTVKFGKEVNITNEPVKTLPGNCSFFASNQKLKENGLNIEECNIQCNP